MGETPLLHKAIHNKKCSSKNHVINLKSQKKPETSAGPAAAAAEEQQEGCVFVFGPIPIGFFRQQTPIHLVPQVLLANFDS